MAMARCLLSTRSSLFYRFAQRGARLDAEGETMLTIPGNPPNLRDYRKVARSSHVVHMRWKFV